MRIKLTFKAGKLPILYHHRFMALIKEALGRADADYKGGLYPDRSSEYSKIAKPFCFSVSMPPMKLKRQVVKHTLKGFREKTGKPYMTLTCFEGCFKLKGNPRDLQMLYQIGIGLRTGSGIWDGRCGIKRDENKRRYSFTHQI